MHVYNSIYMYTVLYTCIHIYMHVYNSIYMYTDLYIHVYRFICMYTTLYTCIQICIHNLFWMLESIHLRFLSVLKADDVLN